MRVLRLNLHFDLLTDIDLPNNIRQLADFLERPFNYKRVMPDFIEENSFNAFLYNRKLGCRMTGSIAVCTLYDNEKPWVMTQRGIVDAYQQYPTSSYLVVK